MTVSVTRKAYFPAVGNAPPPLRARIERRVRFEEVDPLAIVWHGRYPGYLEDARVELGRKYKVGYEDFYAQGYVVPIKKLHIDYISPLRYNDPFMAEAVWHWSEAARLNIEYNITLPSGEITTTAYTVQLLVDLKGELAVIPPEFYIRFLDAWKEGKL